MSLKKQFPVSNLIMLFLPVLIISCITVIMMTLFLSKYMHTKIIIGGSDINNIFELIPVIKNIFDTNPAVIKFFICWVLISTVVIFTTTTVITRHLSKNILMPISYLKDAAQSIEDGDLSGEVLSCRYDEISELCNAFDNMRKKLKESKEKEYKMNEERKMLLAHMSHDLKTPITSIKGYAQGLRDGVASTPEKQKQYLDTIISKADILQNLAGNLSEYSHLELNKTDFKFQTGDFVDFVREAATAFSADFEKAGITVLQKLPDEKIMINADFDKLFRVFSNVFDNALKYRRPESREIKVSVFRGDGGVYAVIEDDGIGIAPEKTKQVFDNFYRVNTARTMNVKGNGLGLGIARLIIEKHSGRIWLSPADKQGTKVTIYLNIR